MVETFLAALTGALSNLKRKGGAPGWADRAGLPCFAFMGGTGQCLRLFDLSQIFLHESLSNYLDRIRFEFTFFIAE